MLSEKELQVIRDRKKDHLQYHNVLLAQRDRTELLKHIDYLNEQLERRSLDDDPVDIPMTTAEDRELLDSVEAIVKGNTAPHHPRGPGKY